MTLEEFYVKVGGNYKETLTRLMSDKFIMKYLGKFLSMSGYEDLEAALEAKDWETAFRASHTLKGICLNMGFSQLAASSSELCETLRHGAPQVDTAPLNLKVQQDYAVVKEAIGEILA